MCARSVLASAVALLAVAIVVVGGRPLIELIFGDSSSRPTTVLMVLIFAPLVGMLGFH